MSDHNKTPGWDTMKTVRALSEAADGLEFFGEIHGEFTALMDGDRVFLETPEGEFPGTVSKGWSPPSGEWSVLCVDVRVFLDCNPLAEYHVHRTLLRSFTALDRLAAV